MQVQEYDENLHPVLDQGHKHYVKRFTCFFEIQFQKIVKSACIPTIQLLHSLFIAIKK